MSSDIGASAAETVGFYNEHGVVLLATWLGGAIPLIASIVFLAGLVALMRRVAGAAGATGGSGSPCC